MTLRPLIFPVASILLFAACGGGEEQTPAEFRFSNDRTAFENEANSVFSFDVRIDEAKTEEVRVQYATVDGSATAGEDYIATSGTLTFAPGETKKSIEVDIIVDEWLEPDENFVVALSAPEGGYLRDNIQEAVGTIRNDDTSIQISDAGYSTPDSYPGMTLVWGDEFDTPGVPDPSKWTYDLGNGAWGWGNNELQNYTNSPENVTVQDGRCYIFARNDGGFTSARLKTQGIFDFQYGRVDIRAILPIGQGIWPAGCSDPTSTRWAGPRVARSTSWSSSVTSRASCTARYTGDRTTPTDSTTASLPPHWNSRPRSLTSSTSSLEWQEDEIKLFLDDQHYHTITPANMNGFEYPFNDAFFFIMNVAIGGNWPGDPDDTTPFPGFMAVDYIRVFQ